MEAPSQPVAAQPEPPPGGPLRCEKCNKDFKTMRNYRTHQVQFHIGLCCYICGKNFSNLYKLDMHKKIHEDPEGQDQVKMSKSVWAVQGSDEEEHQENDEKGNFGKLSRALGRLSGKLKVKKRKYKRKSSNKDTLDSLSASDRQLLLFEQTGDADGDGNKEVNITDGSPGSSTKSGGGSTLLRKGKPVVAQAREIASNVIEYFRREAETGDILLPTSNWMKRAAMATGLSVNLLLHIRKEKELTGTFITPGTKRPRECKITNLPYNEKKLIKEEMQRLLGEGIPVTVDRIMPFARENTSFRGGRTSLWRIMKQVTRRKHLTKGKREIVKQENEVEVPQVAVLKKPDAPGIEVLIEVQPDVTMTVSKEVMNELTTNTHTEPILIAKQDPEPAHKQRTEEDNSYKLSAEQNNTAHMPLASAEALLMLTQQDTEQQPRPQHEQPATVQQQQHQQPPPQQQPSQQQQQQPPSSISVSQPIISSMSQLQPISAPSQTSMSTSMSSIGMTSHLHQNPVVSRPTTMIPTLMNFNPHNSNVTMSNAVGMSSPMMATAHAHTHIPAPMNLMGMQAHHGMGQPQDPITIQLNLPGLQIPGMPQGYGAPHPHHWRKDLSRGKE